MIRVFDSLEREARSSVMSVSSSGSELVDESGLIVDPTVVGVSRLRRGVTLVGGACLDAPAVCLRVAILTNGNGDKAVKKVSFLQSVTPGAAEPTGAS